MLLFHLDEQRWSGLADAKRGELAARCADFAQVLAANGHAQNGVTLHPSFTATTLRLREGPCTLIDGSLSDPNEVLADYQNIECRDLDEAIEMAKQFPPLRAGASVEVRPICTEAGPRVQP